MPAYLVDDEAWAAAEAKADDLLAKPPQQPDRRPLFNGAGCGHPPDPIAEKIGVRWGCHCGVLLDPARGHEIEEALGPVVQCDGCGCHVAIPIGGVR